MHIISIPIAIAAGVFLLALCGPVCWRAARQRKRPQVSLGRLVLMMFAAALLLFAGVRWLKVDRYLAMGGAWMEQQYFTNGMVVVGFSVARHYPRLPEEHELLALNYALRSLPEQRSRVAALKILCELRPDDAFNVMLQHAQECSDPELNAIELRLIGLYRRADTVDFLMERMGSGEPHVRAAAADALGIIHQPAYAMPLSSNLRIHIRSGNDPDPAEMQYCSDPPISLTKFSIFSANEQFQKRAGFPTVLQNQPIQLSSDVRAALERKMLNGITSDEREAAARALLKWPPENYKLRLVEWGVWISDNGELKQLQSVVDEIPPFVHRTGNSVTTLHDRINPITDIVVTKPVIQLTANPAMAVDIDVGIRCGRPWFAYPMPDDFGAMVSAMYNPFNHLAANSFSVPVSANQPLHRGFLSSLDNATIPPLENVGEGYPWLSPRHRTYGGTVGNAMNLADNEITGVGLHWQSIIVSPQQLPWMQPPDCGSNKTFKWWSDLRAVPCSWVSNRGESEKFLYYDGPTLAKAPLKATLENNQLKFALQAMFPAELKNGADATGMKSPVAKGKPRRGMYIRSEGSASVKLLASDPVTLQRQDEVGSSADIETTIAQKEFSICSPNEAELKLKALLTEQGMSDEEAEGMTKCWSEAFFRTPGTRMIYLLRPEEYDELCPIQVQPAPTEMVRVGIVLTEF